MDAKCVDCDNSCEWVRCTQFAGDHYFCDRCARKERDFDRNDSYVYWVMIDVYLRK